MKYEKSEFDSNVSSVLFVIYSIDLSVIIALLRLDITVIDISS